MPRRAARRGSRTKLGQKPRHGVLERGERVVEAPACPIRFVDLVGDGANLHGPDSGELCGAEHGKALHRLDLTTARPADTGARADRKQKRVRQRPAGGVDQARIRLETREHQGPVAGAGIPRAPAMPTWRRESGRSAASACAVEAAASTGPMPQARVAAPSAPASSRSVAATTRIIATNANDGSPERVNPRRLRKVWPGPASQTVPQRTRRSQPQARGELNTKAVHRRGGLSISATTPVGGFAHSAARTGPLARLNT